ncbi:MAG: chemotaxis protein CheW [Hydrogenophaga sp.]|uniref:chemotaxis protein CheW n=1 Tax=Hydrogenophaga sp. TaxID=1904254 RepID=UPI00262DFED1|nr:chemotaxis protein CheW [Hydrogenophaga sp.]MDM7941667.1 chemotaxis protein CheW [Hydrogenophaga sp.]
MDTIPTPTVSVSSSHILARGQSPSSARAGEFLSFRLGAEEYGIDILSVQEIRSYEEPTRIANAPGFIKGVVNLRGVIVPIVDMRIKLGCEKVDYNALTVVIVLSVHDRVVGLVVDSVSDVIRLGQDHIKAAPQISTTLDAGFITGIASVGERMLILANIEALIGSADMGLVTHPTPVQ